MTKIQNPIIGRARGSAGGMTFAKQFDKNTMRAKPFEVANPKTSAQTNQRNFFKEVKDITATVSDDQLRTLFGQKPKGMSRRNMLSKQIASAYSVVNGQKIVDFSKLQAIGSGEKVNMPIWAVVDGRIVGMVAPTLDQFGKNALLSSNLFLVLFDTDNNKIVLINSTYDVEVAIEDIGSVADDISIENGFFYLTIASDGSNVSNLPFGSFTIKTRATNDNTNAGGDTPKAGDVVTIPEGSIGTPVTLNFANYDFNDLVPGSLFQWVEGSKVDLVLSENWVKGDNLEFSADLETDYDPTLAVYLQIMQQDEIVESVPFSVVGR